VSSPNLDAPEGRKHNSAIVADLEYYYPDLTGTNKYLSIRIQGYQGIRVEVTEGARNLCRRLGKYHFTQPTEATGKSQPNREQRKVSEHVSTRLIISTASLLIIADDLVGGV
jgi:hypothetical protein